MISMESPRGECIYAFPTDGLKIFSFMPVFRCKTDLVRQPERSGNNHAILGGYREVAIPVPIPNTEVKHLIANGTIWFAVWESRTLPGYFRITNSLNSPLRKLSGLFCFTSRLRSMGGQV